MAAIRLRICESHETDYHGKGCKATPGRQLTRGSR
jgi:hypothetical protein